MSHFTVIAEVGRKDHGYAIRARNARHALRRLMDKDAFLEWNGFGPKSKARLLLEISDRTNPFPVVTGTRNVRRLAALVRKRLVIFEVTETSRKPLLKRVLQ